MFLLLFFLFYSRLRLSRDLYDFAQKHWMRERTILFLAIQRRARSEEKRSLRNFKQQQSPRNSIHFFFLLIIIINRGEMRLTVRFLNFNWRICSGRCKLARGVCWWFGEKTTTARAMMKISHENRREKNRKEYEHTVENVVSISGRRDEGVEPRSQL